MFTAVCSWSLLNVLIWHMYLIADALSADSESIFFAAISSHYCSFDRLFWPLLYMWLPVSFNLFLKCILSSSAILSMSQFNLIISSSESFLGMNFSTSCMITVVYKVFRSFLINALLSTVSVGIHIARSSSCVNLMIQSLAVFIIVSLFTSLFESSSPKFSSRSVSRCLSSSNIASLSGCCCWWWWRFSVCKL